MAIMKVVRLIALVCLLPLAGAAQQAQVRWMSIEEALKASEKNPRKILIDMYTDWCGWCHKMDRDTFGDSTIAKYISQNYYAVKMNAETQPDFSYKGRTFKLLTAAGKSMNEFVLAVTNNRPSYPSIAYLDEQGNVLTVVPGYQKPENLHPILQFLKEDKFKTMKFEEFVSRQQPTSK